MVLYYCSTVSVFFQFFQLSGKEKTMTENFHLRLEFMFYTKSSYGMGYDNNSPRQKNEYRV